MVDSSWSLGRRRRVPGRIYWRSGRGGAPGSAPRRGVSPGNRPSGPCSVTICPVDDVGQGPPIQIGPQVVAEQVDPAMLSDIAAAGDVRGDEDALVFPEAGIGLVLELAHVDVERDPSEPSVG